MLGKARVCGQAIRLPMRRVPLFEMESVRFGGDVCSGSRGSEVSSRIGLCQRCHSFETQKVSARCRSESRRSVCVIAVKVLVVAWRRWMGRLFVCGGQMIVSTRRKKPTASGACRRARLYPESLREHCARRHGPRLIRTTAPATASRRSRAIRVPAGVKKSGPGLQPIVTEHANLRDLWFRERARRVLPAIGGGVPASLPTWRGRMFSRGGRRRLLGLDCRGGPAVKAKPPAPSVRVNPWRLDSLQSPDLSAFLTDIRRGRAMSKETHREPAIAQPTSI
jgi:hypothetical protein